MPDEEKVAHYSQSRYANLQQSLSTYSTVINYQLGFSLVQTDFPLLSELALRGNATMYMSLITDFLLLLLLYMSSSLLYYLTKILVHNRLGDYRAMYQMGSSKATIS